MAEPENVDNLSLDRILIHITTSSTKFRCSLTEQLCRKSKFLLEDMSEEDFGKAATQIVFATLHTWNDTKSELALEDAISACAKRPGFLKVFSAAVSKYVDKIHTSKAIYHCEHDAYKLVRWVAKLCTAGASVKVPHSQHIQMFVCSAHHTYTLENKGLG